MNSTLRAPFPWFGGKSKVAPIVWQAFGDCPNYVEPFAGSLAVLLGRPHDPKTETVNDLDCVAPSTRILRADMSWAAAGDIVTGDSLLAFDEENGPSTRLGLSAPSRYRRFAHATVLDVRRIVKPCYRLTFDDGTTVVASADHLWLGGSHKSGGAGGGRGWRWLKTANLVCNRATQRSWVLKVCDVVDREDTFDAGWLSGMFDGEGSINVGPGLRIGVSQNEGPILDRAQSLLQARGISVTITKGDRRCRQLVATGGKHEQLGLLMRLRPSRLVRKFVDNCHEVSLYGRDHRAIGLVAKEFIGDQVVVAIETDARTYIAEGLASHNCHLANFWRALRAAPDEVAAHADWPVNEADLHARHWSLVQAEEFRESVRTDPDFYDAKRAGWWVWGICQWIGSGWCDVKDAAHNKRPHLATGGKGIHKLSLNGERGDGRASPEPETSEPHLSTSGMGVHRPSQQLPHLGNAGMGVHRPSQKLPHLGDAGRGWDVVPYMQALAERLRNVRVACGDWSRVLGDSVTWRHGLTGVFLDPPYEDHEGLYAEGSLMSAKVRDWAIEYGFRKDMRIALCGYDGEHSMPDGWTIHAWKAKGGYASQGDGSNENARRERIWFSPACLPLEERQTSLFGKLDT